MLPRAIPSLTRVSLLSAYLIDPPNKYGTDLGPFAHIVHQRLRRLSPRQYQNLNQIHLCLDIPVTRILYRFNSMRPFHFEDF